MTKEQRVLNFKNLLSYYDDLYYNLDKSVISDAEYDSLKEQYLEMIKEDEYSEVPGDVSESLKRVKHTHAITSLAKVNIEEELRKEVKRLWPVVIQPKIDGLTVVGYPGTTMGAGKLVTRGNGEYGEDITHTALKIKDINRINKIDYTVRMEAYMPKSVFAELNEERMAAGLKPFENTRNAAAGMLRHKDVSKVKGVHYFAYNIVGSDISQSDQIDQLKYDKFNIIDTYAFDTIDETVDFIINFPFRGKLDYDIDGLVIKSNRYDSLKEFGSTGHHPKNAFAFKFKSQGVWTKLIDVINQTGRSGKVTPVGIVEPTKLLGSTINRVTLHNFGIIDALKLSKGCDVFLIKANDVIPAITESKNYNPLKKFKEPIICPSCNGIVGKVNDQLFCLNTSCDSKLLYNLCHIAKRDALDIEGLSEETAKKIIDAGYIEHQFDIFDLSIEQIFELEGFAQKSSEKLYNNIQKARNVSLKKFIYASCIPNVGRSISADIAERFGSIESFIEDIKNDCEETAKIDGVGDTLIENIKENWNLLVKLNEKVTPEEKETKEMLKPEKELTFVITGKLEKPRSFYEDVIKIAGHTCSGSVSKKTDYLVCDDPNFVSSKMDKARALNIPIIPCVKLQEIL